MYVHTTFTIMYLSGEFQTKLIKPVLHNDTKSGTVQKSHNRIVVAENISVFLLLAVKD